jgi:hypothetical protein
MWVRFQVLTSIFKMAFIWSAAQCSVEDTEKRCGGIYYLHLQGDVYPDDGGSKFSLYQTTWCNIFS